MKYSISVATDCNGDKVNLRFLFDTCGPSVAQLFHCSTVAFNNLFQLRSVGRTFTLSAAVVFDDMHCAWDRLERSTQLLHNSQVYLFQPDILDVPAIIPEPFEGHPFLGDDYVLPERNASNSPRATAPPAFRPGPLLSLHSPRAVFLSSGAARGPSVFRAGGRSSFDGRGAARGAEWPGRCVTPQRGRNGCATDFTPLWCSAPRTFSHSPSARKPVERVATFHANRGGSILREEREKIEYQWRLPLDEMRRSLKEETLQLERSISPMRKTGGHLNLTTSL